MKSFAVIGICIYFLCTSFLYSQNLDQFFQWVNTGEIDKVREELPRLLESYPNNPGVMFLDAITTERAEEAIITYRKILQNHPHSEYADDSIMKIGEYFFARGLYSQASRLMLRIPKVYPRSEHLQRAIDLHVNSLLAIGEKDSLDFYLQVYKKRFSNLDLNYNFESEKPLTSRPLKPVTTEGMKLKPASVKPVSATKSRKTSVITKSSQPSSGIKEKSSGPKPFVIQVGAYGSPENAIRQKMLLEQRGYDIHIGKIKSRGKTLTVIQVVRYATKSEAEKVAKKLKSEFGYNYLILNRPE
ncbi:MAG: SPOR domain-containing protein [Candidatus Marinimicrobia bacterium]|nr:SPOR domain-containing protein [Candidatus Neomarinimicrobiota bacterium]